MFARRSFVNLSVAFSLAAVFCFVAVLADEKTRSKPAQGQPAFKAEDVAFFEQDVLPILRAN